MGQPNPCPPVGYRPQSSDTASDAIQSTNHFIECLRSLCTVNASIVLVGDFNFPNIAWSNLQFAVDNDRCSTCFSMFVKQYCFDQLVSEHTRLQSSGKDSLLDLILCNYPFIVCDVAICDPFSISDHCSIKFKVITQRNLPVYPHMILGISILQIGVELQVIQSLVIGELFSKIVLLLVNLPMLFMLN